MGLKAEHDEEVRELGPGQLLRPIANLGGEQLCDEKATLEEKHKYSLHGKTTRSLR
jgi:hypothetical protein